ncbi:MAG: hypothetical protein QM811_24520 [Pirellulales bacterium]
MYAAFLGRYRDVDAAFALLDELAKDEQTRMIAILNGTEILRFRYADLDDAAQRKTRAIGRMV